MSYHLMRKEDEPLCGAGDGLLTYREDVADCVACWRVEAARGYRAGIEAAAKILDAEARPFAMRGGSHYLIITQAAVAIRALSAPAAPTAPERGACEHKNYRVNFSGEEMRTCPAGCGAFWDSHADKWFGGEPNREAGRCNACNCQHTATTCSGCCGRGWNYDQDGGEDDCPVCKGTGSAP